MKAILVIDVNMTQDNKHICEDDKQHCPLWNKDVKFCMYDFNNNTKGCPLKPMPEAKDVGYPNEDYDVGFGDGWDACLKEITGEEE